MWAGDIHGLVRSSCVPGVCSFGLDNESVTFLEDIGIE